MKYRNTASYGKRQEYIAMTELIKREFDVYPTLIDDQGIDCVLRINDKRYLDIQIKARSKEQVSDPKNYAFFPLLQVPSGRDNYFFILYSEASNSYWIIPSEDIISMAKIEGSNISQILSGDNKGKYKAKLAGVSKGQSIPNPKFDKYRNQNGFSLLK